MVVFEFGVVLMVLLIVIIVMTVFEVEIMFVILTIAMNAIISTGLLFC